MDRREALDIMQSVAAGPAAYAGSAKERTGRPVIGTVCTYVPEEVILAAGAMPFRILQGPAQSPRADACMQSYSCCFARGALEFALTDQLDFLDGVVFSNTCDTMQCLYDIWVLNNCGRIVESFMMPVHVSHPAARTYLIAEIERLVGSLGAALGRTIEPAALSDAVASCRRARTALSRLSEQQRRPSPVLTPRQYYDAITARWFLPPDEYCSLIDAVLSDPGPVRLIGPRLVVAGGPLLDPTLPDLLTDLGTLWVDDDLCTGSRSAWTGEQRDDGDPVAAIADRLLARQQCPAKHSEGHDPGEPVVASARRARAAGVILYRLKFCDPHAFDYPRIKQSLDDAGVPSLLIEVESPSGSPEQMRTRLQAFLEMLSESTATEAPA